MTYKAILRTFLSSLMAPGYFKRCRRTEDHAPGQREWSHILVLNLEVPWSQGDPTCWCLIMYPVTSYQQCVCPSVLTRIPTKHYMLLGNPRPRLPFQRYLFFCILWGSFKTRVSEVTAHFQDVRVKLRTALYPVN